MVSLAHRILPSRLERVFYFRLSPGACKRLLPESGREVLFGRFAFTGFTLCEDCIDLDIQNAKGQVLYSSGRLVKLCLSGINVELTSSECDLRIAKT